MSDVQRRLAELRKQGARRVQVTGLDYLGGIEGYTYKALEHGPSMLAAEASLRARGYELAPESDTVDLLICAGMLRVHRRPERPGEFAVWRAPIEWELELLREESRQTMRRSDLSGPAETEDQKIARLRAELQRLGAH